MEQLVVQTQQSVGDTDRHVMKLACSMSTDKMEPYHADICTSTQPSCREYVAVLVTNALTQYRCHVLRSPGPSDETCSGVLGGLQPLKQLTTDACENTVTEVNSTADEGIH